MLENKVEKLNIVFAIQFVAGGGGQTIVNRIIQDIDPDQFQCHLLVNAAANEAVVGIPEDKAILLSERGVVAPVRAVFQLTALWKKLDPDVICTVVHRIHYLVAVSLFWRRKKAKLIFWHHTNITGALESKQFAMIKKVLSRIVLRRADIHLCVSEGIRQDLVGHYRISPRKTKVLYNPFDITEIMKKAREPVGHPWFKEPVPVILACGRLSLEKNYPLLLHAVKDISKTFPVRLIILGEGPMRPDLLELAEKLEIAEQVQLLGFRSNPYAFMSRSAVFVLSSSWEGFGNVLVEAMAAGVPVVSTDCPSGPGEIIQHRKSGLLVPPSDHHQLAKSILEILRGPDLRNTLIAGGRTRAEFFDRKNIIPRYESVFYNVLPGPGNTP